MPEYTVSLLRHVLETHGVDTPEPRILLLGLTYKADIEELRNAPALEVARQLAADGATVLGVDPMLDDWGEVNSVERVSLPEIYEQDADAVVVVTPHSEFDELDWDAFDAPIIDGRQSIDESATDAPVYTIGGPWP
jgi:UDP-N-acetyl-D-mannosaminuronic acid dehydrogenase